MAKVATATITEDQVREACLAIYQRRNTEKSLNYAVNYSLQAMGMSGYELYVQILYVTNNLASWRGDKAREVKAVLKQYLKENKARYSK